MGEKHMRDSMRACSGGLKRNLLDSIAENDIEERKREEKLHENGESHPMRLQRTMHQHYTREGQLVFYE